MNSSASNVLHHRRCFYNTALLTEARGAGFSGVRLIFSWRPPDSVSIRTVFFVDSRGVRVISISYRLSIRTVRIGRGRGGKGEVDGAEARLPFEYHAIL